MPPLFTAHLSKLVPSLPLKPEDREVWVSTWISVGNKCISHGVTVAVK